MKKLRTLDDFRKLPLSVFHDASLLEQYRDLLRKAGEKQATRGRVAAFLGVSVVEVYRWEKGIVSIKPIYIKAYLDHLRKIHKNFSPQS